MVTARVFDWYPLTDVVWIEQRPDPDMLPVIGVETRMIWTHETGRIRGMLCSPCNTGIGLLRDDPAIIRKAAEYLNAH